MQFPATAPISYAAHQLGQQSLQSSVCLGQHQGGVPILYGAMAEKVLADGHQRLPCKQDQAGALPAGLQPSFRAQRRNEDCRVGVCHKWTATGQETLALGTTTRQASLCSCLSESKGCRAAAQRRRAGRFQPGPAILRMRRYRPLSRFSFFIGLPPATAENIQAR